MNPENTTPGPEGKMMQHHRMERRRATFTQELALIAGLVFMWCALWQEFNVGSLLFGTVVAILVVKIFYLPPFEVSDRLNLGWLPILGGIFLWDLITQSFRVFWVALTKGKKTHSAVIGASLHTDSDLITTLTALTISLIPGSTILEIDRSTRTIYLHVLDVENLNEVEKSRRSVQKYEELIILVFGTKRQVATLRIMKKRERKSAQGKTFAGEGEAWE